MIIDRANAEIQGRSQDDFSHFSWIIHVVLLSNVSMEPPLQSVFKRPSLAQSHHQGFIFKFPVPYHR